MIEFDGAALIATEASFLLGPSPSSLPEYAATLDGGGTLLPNGSDGGTLLKEDSGGSGDEWIASMLSSASPGAVAAGIILAGDDDLIDRLSAEGEGEEIIIPGKRLHEISFNGEIGGGSGTAGGNTGGGGSGTGAIAVAPHPGNAPNSCRAAGDRQHQNHELWPRLTATDLERCDGIVGHGIEGRPHASVALLPP
jgi:hypothetical protein